jgi:enoyl-CoA hydratase/carnithine racemase
MLPKVVGNDSLLRELQLTGRSMHADEALRFGLVSRVLGDHSSLMAAALDLAGTIARKSPLAVTGTKNLLNYTRVYHARSRNSCCILHEMARLGHAVHLHAR